MVHLTIQKHRQHPGKACVVNEYRNCRELSYVQRMKCTVVSIHLHLGDVGTSECLQQHRLSLVVLVMRSRNEPRSTPPLNAPGQNISGLGTPPSPRPLLHAGPWSARTTLVRPFSKRTKDCNGVGNRSQRGTKSEDLPPLLSTIERGSN